MKRIITLLASAALVASAFSVVPANAADGDEVKFFLRSTGCSKADVNFDYLSVADEDDAIECNYTSSGIRNEIGGSNPTPATPARETATRYWDTTDGGPIVLDASRPVTGSIFTAGGACVVSTAPCSPVTVSGGEVILDIALVGISGGTEVELGAQTETFTAGPGSPRETVVNIQPDAAQAGKIFEVIEVRTWIHGKSAGHGVIKTNGDFSSFVSVPTVGASAGTPPGKNDPPGKKKGCTKGKGKKRGCEGKGKKAPKPGKPAASCAPYVPGEMGAEAETTIVTDDATEEKPFEMEVPLGPATGTYGGDRTTRMKHNVQVDTKNEDAGLFIRLETPALEDPDLYAYWPSGSQAAMAAGFNPLLAAGPLPSQVPFSGGLNGTGSGGHSEFTAEQIDGLRTADCQGWTLDLVNWAGRGGTYTLKVWLGDVVNEPAEEK